MLFDINNPAPIVFQSNCFQYYNSTYNCSVYPYSVNQSFVMSASTTLQNYTTGSNYTHNVYATGMAY